MICTITREGTDIAAGQLTKSLTLKSVPGLPEDYSLELFYFKKIDMAPAAVFKHLGGVALSAFLDFSWVRQPDGLMIGPLRYIHGRSEVMKGKQTISAVLLCLPYGNESLSATEWLKVVPGIYKEFMDKVDLSGK